MGFRGLPYCGMATAAGLLAGRVALVFRATLVDGSGRDISGKVLVGVVGNRHLHEVYPQRERRVAAAFFIPNDCRLS